MQYIWFSVFSFFFLHAQVVFTVRGKCTYREKSIPRKVSIPRNVQCLRALMLGGSSDTLPETGCLTELHGLIVLLVVCQTVIIFSMWFERLWRPGKTLIIAPGTIAPCNHRLTHYENFLAFFAMDVFYISTNYILFIYKTTTRIRNFIVLKN